VLVSALTPHPSAIIAERLDRTDAALVLARGGFDPDKVLTSDSLPGTFRGVGPYRRGLAPLLSSQEA
jgi:hypothetical protein